jgi:hypothetical protein
VRETRTVTNSYTLGQLAIHPATRDIVFQRLNPLNVPEEKIRMVDGMLDEMRSLNMGGGIPLHILIPLMEELDAVGYPLPPHS